VFVCNQSKGLRLEVENERVKKSKRCLKMALSMQTRAASVKKVFCTVGGSFALVSWPLAKLVDYWCHETQTLGIKDSATRNGSALWPVKCALRLGRSICCYYAVNKKTALVTSVTTLLNGHIRRPCWRWVFLTQLKVARSAIAFAGSLLSLMITNRKQWFAEAPKEDGPAMPWYGRHGWLWAAWCNCIRLHCRA